MITNRFASAAAGIVAAEAAVPAATNPRMQREHGFRIDRNILSP
jgi:hypothetical protein